MLNIVDGAGREIVYHRHFVAALQVSISKVGTYETSATGYEYTQILALLCSINFRLNPNQPGRQARLPDLRDSLIAW
jgi:hypothetical protein